MGCWEFFSFLIYTVGSIGTVECSCFENHMLWFLWRHQSWISPPSWALWLLPGLPLIHHQGWAQHPCPLACLCTNQPRVSMPPSCSCRQLTWRLSELGIISSPNPHTPFHQSFHFSPSFRVSPFWNYFCFLPIWSALISFVPLFIHWTHPVLPIFFAVSFHVSSHLDDSNHLWLPERLHCVGSLPHQCDI